MSAWIITDIILRTDKMRPHGQDIVVLVQLDDGREVEIIREFGALPDISIHHCITHHGISDAISRAEAA